MFLAIEQDTNRTKISAQFRIPFYLGGDDNRILDVSICNDTGSNIQTIYERDFNHLNNNQAYRGPMNHALISGVNGVAQYPTVMMELRITKLDNATQQFVPMTQWIAELFVVRQYAPSTNLLSGNEMRKVLFFATAPGTDFLYVAGTRNGLLSILPALQSPFAL